MRCVKKFFYNFGDGS